VISVLVSEMSAISDISNAYHESTANIPTHKKYMCIFIEIFQKE